jgi:hypothetical protein
LNWLRIKVSGFYELTYESSNFTQAEHFLYWVCLSPFKEDPEHGIELRHASGLKRLQDVLLELMNLKKPHASEIKDNCFAVLL